MNDPNDDVQEDLRDDAADGAAILARRQRFIALALGVAAVTTGAACRPQPCLSVVPPDDVGEAGPPVDDTAPTDEPVTNEPPAADDAGQPDEAATPTTTPQ